MAANFNTSSDTPVHYGVYEFNMTFTFKIFLNFSLFFLSYSKYDFKFFMICLQTILKMGTSFNISYGSLRTLWCFLDFTNYRKTFYF